MRQTHECLSKKFAFWVPRTWQHSWADAFPWDGSPLTSVELIGGERKRNKEWQGGHEDLALWTYIFDAIGFSWQPTLHPHLSPVAPILNHFVRSAALSTGLRRIFPPRCLYRLIFSKLLSIILFFPLFPSFFSLCSRSSSRLQLFLSLIISPMLSHSYFHHWCGPIRVSHSLSLCHSLSLPVSLSLPLSLSLNQPSPLPCQPVTKEMAKEKMEENAVQMSAVCVA